MPWHPPPPMHMILICFLSTQAGIMRARLLTPRRCLPFPAVSRLVPTSPIR